MPKTVKDVSGINCKECATTFRDRDNILVTGTVSRINKKTVTVAPDNNDGHWRVSAALLNHLVDI